MKSVVGYHATTQSWVNVIFSFLFFAIVFFIFEFFGIGDWIKRNAIWFLLFAIGVVELDLIGTIQQLARLIKNDSENKEEDLMEKIGQLETDVDYIKNTVRELKERK